jgi:hypothetical protein
MVPIGTGYNKGIFFIASLKKYSMKKVHLIALSALIIITGKVYGQTDLQNTGILYISSSPDILYVSGSLTNASGAAFTNNGSLHVKQNLVNGQASMAVGTGTLLLNGTSAQTVSGAQPFNTFNLVTNNTAGITLNNDLSVSGAHTFTAGIITSSATPNYLMYAVGSSYSGDGDAKHVNGWVRKTGATNFTFPLGNGTVERTIAASSLSASSVFNAKYAGATTNTANFVSPLVTVDPNEYWIVNQVSGGTAKIDMNWDNSKVAMPNYLITDIRVANYIAANWTQVGGTATGNVATTGTISSNTISAFGSFVLGSVSFSLPANLIQFSASRSNGNTVVSWTTTDEFNVNYYETLRSDDGIQFYAVGNTPARNTTGTQQYEITDDKPIKGIAYYRLRSVDRDGKIKLSKVVVVNDRLSEESYFTVANPAHTAITISAGSSYNGEYSYHLNTLNGQTILQGKLNITRGGTYSIPLSPSVIRGVYILDVQYANFHYQQKILVQ